jgi:predicted DNA binding CopG/RHH family protein/uncharacterized DUF497 family protein
MSVRLGSREHKAPEAHKIAPLEAEEVLRNDPLVVQFQEREDEERLLVLGQTNAGRLLAVIYTERDVQIRVVTAYPMTKQLAAFISGSDKAMEKKKMLAIPRFKSEAQEAEWWDSHPEFLAEQFKKAAKEGRILRGVPKSQSVTIRISTTDVEAARRQAERKGLPYQTYIKMLLHQGLARDRSGLWGRSDSLNRAR